MVARDISLSERWQPSEEIRTLQHEVSCDAERRLAYEGTRALGEALAGHPVDALRIAAGVRSAAAVTSMSILRLELAAAEAIAHRELGDRLRAHEELIALGAASVGPVVYATLLAELELTQMHLDEGDVTRAHAAFTRASELVESDFDGSGGRSWLGRAGTLVALADGNIENARRWSATIDDSFWGPISRARIQLMLGERSSAMRFCDEAAARCTKHEVIQGLLRSRALTKHDESVDQAGYAAELASTCSLVQTVASEGPECLRLVELAAWRLPPAWLDRVRRTTTAVGNARLESLGMVESLTAREREVLRLLPSRLTLREIADELFISMNTLKFHLKVIYRKLGCSSRADAAALSQGTNLTPHRRQPSDTLRR
jgi:LuxR family maltose regulon positive regulatory protein